MKRLIPFLLAFLMLLSLCACRGNFGSIDLQDAIEIPEDGIVKKSTIEQIKEKNAIAAFYGESNGYQYEWTIFGSDIKEPKEVNLLVDIQKNSFGELSVSCAQEATFGFPALLSIHTGEKWNALSATALSLILSMTLRFVPKFKAQLDTVAEAQRSIGWDVSTGSLWQRTRTAITILSIMITWALENAIETADSMKSRGYGLKGRSAFSIYRLDDRDRMALLWLGFCGLYLICGTIGSAFGFRYFPSIRCASLNVVTLSFHLVYLMLCATPIFLNALEDRKWKAIVSDM